MWRSATIEPGPAGSGHELWQADDAPSLHWLMHILDPWFGGKAYLNADVLRGVLQALVADADVRLLGSEIGDEDALQGLEQYAAACKKFFPDEARYGPEGA